jgi:hypothetical protein
MNIRWAKAYRVDNEAGTIEEIDHEGRLGEYVKFYMNALRDSKRTAPYLPEAQSTQVVSLMCKSTHATLVGSTDEEIESYRQEINKRFLFKETEAQKKVAQLSTVIKNGCLIHALVCVGGCNYYLIAKLNWNEYLERTSMERSSGIAFDEKVLGRSCLARLEQRPMGMFVTSVEVSLDTANVKYFVTEFLEVIPVYDDAKSTENMTQSVVKLIDKAFKQRQPRVRLELKNAFLCKVRSSERVDYGLIVDEVFASYFASPACPIDPARSQGFLDDLEELPEDKQFARQFDLVPKSIKPKIVNTTYNLGRGVSLQVTDSAGTDPLDNIESGRESDGRTYLKIYTTEQEAIRTFNPANHMRVD